MRFLDRLEVADVIALLVILGIIIANFKGVEFMLPQAGLLVIGYYFGRKLTKNGH